MISQLFRSLQKFVYVGDIAGFRNGNKALLFCYQYLILFIVFLNVKSSSDFIWPLTVTQIMSFVFCRPFFAASDGAYHENGH